MEKSKMAYLILKNLYNGIILSPKELGLSKREYAEILDRMQKKNFITGVNITSLDQERVLINNQNEAITVAGINYLMENTVPDHECKMLFSVDELVSGFELNTSVYINGIVHRYKKIYSKPLPGTNIAAEAFVLAAEGLKREGEIRKHAV